MEEVDAAIEDILEYIGNSEIKEAIVEEVIAPLLEASDWSDLPDGKEQRMVPFSEKFWEPKYVPDHLVPDFRGYDSKEPQEFYVPPEKEFEWFSLSIVSGAKCLVIGPTGCGKTLMAEYYAAITGRPCLRVDHTQELDKVQTFGQTHINNEGGVSVTEFIPGDIPLSASTPCIVILDEVSRATGGANMIYKRMLDRNTIYLPEMKQVGEKEIIPHPHWVVCGTDNTKGDGEDLDKYPMSNVQDAAFRNAWDILIEADYLKPSAEAALIRKMNSSIPKPDADKLAKFSKLMHDAFKSGQINTAFSPRQLKTICSFMERNVSMLNSIAMAYVSFCSKSEIADVSESLRAVFGSDK
jgi:MoxR-like ATPase